MLIYPKIDSTFVGEDKVSQYITTGLEIQLLDLAGSSINKTIDQLKFKYKGLEEVTFHLPMPSCDIEFILTNTLLYSQVLYLLTICEICAKQHNIHVNLLAHSSWNYEMLERARLIEPLLSLIEEIEGTRVKILLENTPTKLEHPFSYESSIDVVRKIKTHNLKCCFDICHLHCVFNMLQKDLSYLATYYDSNIDLSKEVYQIHFSDTLNNDGYIDSKNTHSKPHNPISLEVDYDILQRLNINKKPIVTEICEDGCNGWKSRKGQVKELKLLQKKQDFLIFQQNRLIKIS